MRRDSFVGKICAALLLGILLASAMTQVQAQNFNAQKRPASESETLTSKVPIKDLPEYTGKQKFFSGNTLKTSIGPQYQQQFIAMEDPTQVINWYKTALAGYKWEVISSEDNAVAAKKPDGAHISIIVNPYHRPDGRSMVTINYNEYHLERENDATE